MALSVKEFQTELKKIFPQALVIDASGEVESLAYKHPELNHYYCGEELTDVIDEFAFFATEPQGIQ